MASNETPQLVNSSSAVFFKILLAMASLIFSVESHELVHLLTGRALGIPSRFLNLTAAGVPKLEAAQQSAANLAWMNGVAPAFSFLILGIGSYIWLRSRHRPPNALFQYWVSWLAIFNIPYLGLQMMFMGTRARSNGTGNDFATVFDFLGVSPTMRAALGVCGFVVFIVLNVPIGSIISAWSFRGRGSQQQSDRVSNLRWVIATIILAIGFALAIYAVPYLENQGMLMITGDFLLISLAMAILVPWKTIWARTLLNDWLVPGLLGTLALVPFGMEGNDFMTLWVFVLPMVTTSIFFSCLR